MNCVNQLIIMSVMGTRMKNDCVSRIYNLVQISSSIFGFPFCFTDENTESQRKTYPHFYKYCRLILPGRILAGGRWSMCRT